jgi:hypothetical protein
MAERQKKLQRPSIVEDDLFNRLLEVASQSGKFTGDDLEQLYGLREKKDDPAYLEAEPPLLVDETVTFGEDDPQRAIRVRLKKLGFDYYEYLLPRFTEYVFSLYGEDSLSLLETTKPKRLIMKVVSAILDRPSRDRLKVSLFETLSYTFSTPDVPVSAGFLYICPPDEIIEACWRLVEINERNFTRAWGRVPHLFKNQLGLLYLTFIETIETLSVTLRESISSMPRELLAYLWNSGGLSDIGTAGSSESVETKQENPLPPSKPKRQRKSG